MATDCKAGSFNITTQAAGNTVAVTGLGFQPEVIIFWWNGRTESTDAIGRADSRKGFGVCVGTTSRWAIASLSQDALASSNTIKYNTDANCIITVDPTIAINGAADLQSFDSDGFTLVIDSQFSVNNRIGYLALAGDATTSIAIGSFAEPAGTGDQDITGLGFQPEFLLVGSVSVATVPAGAGSANHIMIGMATGASNQAIYGGGAQDSQATMNTDSYMTDTEIIAMQAATGATNGLASFSSFLADGFRVNWSQRTGGARLVHYLALAGGDYSVGDLLTQTDTTTDIVVSGLGWQPSGGLVVSHGEAENSFDAPAPPDRLSMGGFSDATTRVALGVLDENAVADSEITSAIETDAVYVNIDTGSAVQGLMDVKSVDSGGVTFIMDDADPSQAFFLYALFGPAVAGGTTEFLNASGSVTPTGAIAKQAQTAYSGVTAPDGSVISGIQTLLAGSVTPTGSLAVLKIVLLTIAGAIAASGTIIKSVLTSYVGITTPSGQPIENIQTTLSGEVTPTGNLTKSQSITLEGAIAASGALLNQVQKLLLGIIIGTSNLIKSVSTSYVGVVDPEGNAIENAQTTLSGEVTPSGSLVNIKSFLLEVSGVVIATGGLIKSVLTSYVGITTPSGQPVENVQTALSGEVTPTGSLAVLKIVLLTIAGAITATGNLIKQVGKNLTGDNTPVGNIIKQIQTAYSGQISPTGEPDQNIQTSLAGIITAVGSLTNLVIPGGVVIKIESLFKGMFKGMFKRMR